MLQVIINRYNCIETCSPNTAKQRIVLAIIPHQIDAANICPRCGYSLDDLPTSVSAGIINEYHLPLRAEGGEHGFQALHQGRQNSFAVKDRNDHRERTDLSQTVLPAFDLQGPGYSLSIKANIHLAPSDYRLPGSRFSFQKPRQIREFRLVGNKLQSQVQHFFGSAQFMVDYQRPGGNAAEMSPDLAHQICGARRHLGKQDAANGLDLFGPIRSLDLQGCPGTIQLLQVITSLWRELLLDRYRCSLKQARNSRSHRGLSRVVSRLQACIDDRSKLRIGSRI